MCKMSQPGLPGAHTPGCFYCFRNTEVRWVRRTEQCVEHQHIDPSQRIDGFRGKRFSVGDVTQMADTIAVNGHRAVRNRERRHVDFCDTKRFTGSDSVRVTLGLAGSRQRVNRIVEDIGESLGQTRHHFRRAVHVDWRFTAIRERADIVDPVHVIGVVVREKNRTYLVNARIYQLQPELWRSVDQNVRATVGFNQRADTCSLIAWIGRPAHLAAAADLGDTKAGSRAQKGEFQTVSTFSKLVVPGVSNGTPAVTIIRSPGVASSRVTTTPLVCSIISS